MERQGNFSDFLSFFKNKTVAVIVPHPDDETITAGSLLYALRKTANRKIIYASNGDFFGYGEMRLQEAQKAAAVFGVKKKDVIFLGYPDTVLFDKTAHSLSKHKETYGLSAYPEYTYQKNGFHRSYTVKDFYTDLTDVLNEIQPDIIVTTGPDDHPDHAGLYQAVKTVAPALSKVPAVFYALAYSNGYHTVGDYSAYNLKSTVFNRSDYGCNLLCDEPLFDWEERLRLPVHRKCRTSLIPCNRTFRSMFCHHSQIGLVCAPAIANGDAVYWTQGNTDSAPLWFIKICIDNHFAYRWYSENSTPLFSVCGYNTAGKKQEIPLAECSVFWNGTKVSSLQNLNLSKRSNTLTVTYREKSDTVTVIRAGKWFPYFQRLGDFANHCFRGVGIRIQKSTSLLQKRFFFTE